MTEEKKQALTGLCKIEIKRWKAASESNPNMRYMVELMEVALAELTAPPVKVDDSMALAFHKALNDGGVGHEDLEEIKVGLEAALCNITRPAPANDLVPVEWTNEQCLEFLSIAFRHAEISGDIEMDDIRLAVKMVNGGARNY